MADFQDLTSRAVAGAVAGNLTVTGIKLGDRLILVQDLTAGSPNLVAEFTITADNTINNTAGTSTNGHTVLVMWEKRYGFRSPLDSGDPARRGRSPF